MTRLFNLNLDIIYSYSFLQEPLEVRKDDRDTTTVEVTATNKGKPFNLKGWKIVYECRLANGSFVRDDGSKFNNIKVIDEAKGIFRYTFINEAISAVGKVTKAYFSFEKADSSLQNPIDRVTTRDFKYKVISDAISGSSGVAAHYVSELEKIIEEMKKASDAMDLDAILKKIKEIQDQIGKVDFVKRGGDTMTGDLNFDATQSLKRITSYDGAKALFSLSFAKNGMFFAEDRQNQNFNVFVYDPAKQEFVLNANTNLLKKTEIYKDWIRADGRPNRLADETDLNTVIKPGIHDVRNPKNSPVGDWVFLEVIQQTDQFVLQRLTSFISTQRNRMWTRTCINGVWDDWEEKGSLEKVAADPMTHLNSAKILTRIPTKQNISGVDMWLQGVNVNDSKNEVYASYIDGNGTKLRVEIFDFNAKSLGQRTFTTPSNSYTESLPYWYNQYNQLNFIIRLHGDSRYSILNFDNGTTSGPHQLQGRRTIAARDGNRMITLKENEQTGAITGMYVYDWDSVINGKPQLLAEKNFETTSNKPEKTQGAVQNKGYTFLCQGEWKGHPHLTVIDNTGKIQNVFRYSKRSLAEIINKKYPNGIPANQMDTWEYESEGGCTYKGRLVTTQVASDWAYLFVHNSADGTPIEVEPDGTQVASSGSSSGGLPTIVWFNRNSFNYPNGTNNIIKHDIVHRWTQGKPPVTYDGTYYKTTEDGMYDIDVFLSLLCKGADSEHTIAVDFMRDSDNSVVMTQELDSFANGYENRYARLYGKTTWYFEKDTRFKIMYKNNDGSPSEHYETRVTIRKT
ncbi:BppU family phage baseplate upper protein [Bacillus toyonensis]|uniref:BppU family phage baseplate upper protein n=1 Tax=Bacillus toyonensis TaxID=155322 RepID=UPI0034654A8C